MWKIDISLKGEKSWTQLKLIQKENLKKEAGIYCFISEEEALFWVTQKLAQIKINAVHFPKPKTKTIACNTEFYANSNPQIQPNYFQ